MAKVYTLNNLIKDLKIENTRANKSKLVSF